MRVGTPKPRLKLKDLPPGDARFQNSCRQVAVEGRADRVKLLSERDGV